MKKSNKPYIVTNPEIEDMAKVIQKSFDDSYYGGYDPDAEITAEDLYNVGYRKQSEGEWLQDFDGDCYCPFCAHYPKEIHGR